MGAIINNSTIPTHLLRKSQSMFEIAKVQFSDLKLGNQENPPEKKKTLRELKSDAKSPFEEVISRRAALENVCQDLGYRTTFVEDLPFKDYNYEDVDGCCCENVIGYVPIPVGVAGQILVDGQKVPLPMATTEGALIASVSRGCKAINLSGGASTLVITDAITRAPCLRFSDIKSAHQAKNWMESHAGRLSFIKSFTESSRYCSLVSLNVMMVGNYLYPRFVAKSGDAMGMNMITKCVQKAICDMKNETRHDFELVSLSGNVCSDKKAAAINWIEGRGKSVVAQCRIPSSIIHDVLKTTISDLLTLNCAKNHVGSAAAGTIGGFNAHASNIVSAIFLATGQDVAQNVESSSSITMMERSEDDLLLSVSMPSVEVGTIGGGAELSPQASMLDLLGVRAIRSRPGQSSQQLARIIGAAVLAGELSLCSALASDDLVSSHMTLNRKERSSGS